MLLTPSRYRKPEPAWETVLDVDALGAAEGVSWVWAGSTVLDETLTLGRKPQTPNSLTHTLALSPNPYPVPDCNSPSLRLAATRCSTRARACARTA